MSGLVAAGLDGLVARYGLDADAHARLGVLLRALVEDPRAPTTLRDPARALDDHLADALVALELDAVARATTMADLGSGAGVPGVALAIARPQAEVHLVEATERKCAFLRDLVRDLGLERVTVESSRAEDFGRTQRGGFDLVTARALAGLAVVAEYAAPLLRVGGTLVVWRGGRDHQAEVEAEAAAIELELSVGPIVPVSPYPGAQRRHLHLMSKVGDTPDRFPRRAGMALKRPLGRA